MRVYKCMPIAVMLAAACVAGAVSAEPAHVVGRAEMQAAIAARAGDQAAQRAVIQGLLARPEVRDLAAGWGLDLVRAGRGAANLEGAELERLAAQATAAETQLAGGATTVVLTTTALLIILLIVILLAG